MTEPTTIPLWDATRFVEMPISRSLSVVRPEMTAMRTPGTARWAASITPVMIMIGQKPRTTEKAATASPCTMVRPVSVSVGPTRSAT